MSAVETLWRVTCCEEVVFEGRSEGFARGEFGRREEQHPGKARLLRADAAWVVVEGPERG